MKNIKISILCAIIIATSAHCSEPTDNQKKQMPNSTLSQNVSVPKEPSSKVDEKSITISEKLHDFAHQTITVKKVALFATTCAMALILVTTIKSDLYPSNEPEAIRDLKDAFLILAKESLCLTHLLIQKL